MNVTIFKDITTEEVLCKLEEEGAKYKGLYVDMNNIDERRFVKKSAETINKLLKVVDGARIDKSRDFKNQVEKEAEAIKYRLEEANRPYTLLIDAHKKERDAILSEEKRKREAKELAEQIEKDHEFALLLDDQMMYEKHLAEENRLKEEEKIKEEAAAKAVEEHKLMLERQEQQRINEESARLANVEHLKQVNNEILDSLINLGMEDNFAKLIISKIAKNKIPNVYIKY